MRFENIFPFIIPIIIFSIPIIAILTSHQRKMAELLNRGPSDPMLGETVRQLQMQVEELKRQIYVQQGQIAQMSAVKPIESKSVPPSLPEDRSF